MTAIVLTGTILPQSNFVGVIDFEVRRAEYLRCLNYYKGFGRVFFLENSEYDVEADGDFRIENVTIIKFSEREENAFTFGKGYQEFKMLDAFVSSDRCPDRFFKITGRRYIQNFHYFAQELDGSSDAVFDLVRRHRIADTSFFFCTRGFYQKYILGTYQQVNDERGRWIERVLYTVFHDRVATRFFSSTPIFDGLSGSTGAALTYPRWKVVVKNFLRRVFPVFGRVEL